MTVMLFAMATATLGVGDFIIQNALLDQIFTVNGSTNNTFSTGELSENSSLLRTVYWQIASVATPSNGDTTHLSTADQIFDYIATLNFVANAWDSLNDMVLADGQIYVGNSSDEPSNVTMSGDATIDNAGAVTLDAAIMRDAEIVSWGYWNESTDVGDDEINETAINFSTACAAGNHYYLDGTNLACESDDDTTYTADSPLNLTGTVFGMINCSDNQIYKMDGADWRCEADAGAGISDIIEDTTPQLGGNLDVNDFGIDGGGATNMTIDGSGNLIIVLA